MNTDCFNFFLSVLCCDDTFSFFIMTESRKNRIIEAISQAIDTSFLDVIDESYQHNVPENAQTHFKVIVISQSFLDLSLVKRHQKINALLKNEFATGLHALALHTFTPDEWQSKKQQENASPNCLGGKKKEQLKDR